MNMSYICVAVTYNCVFSPIKRKRGRLGEGKRMLSPPQRKPQSELVLPPSLEQGVPTSWANPPLRGCRDRYCGEAHSLLEKPRYQFSNKN